MTDRHFRSARSTSDTVSTIVTELSQGLGRAAQSPSLMMLFASHEHLQHLQELLDALATQLDVDTLMGCSGVGIVTDDQEIQDRSCVTLWAAWLPHAQIQLRHVSFAASPSGAGFTGWPDDLLITPSTTILQLAEPYSFPSDVFLDGVNRQYPRTPVVGGVASGLGPGEAKLILRDQVLDEGAIIATLDQVPMTTFVSQGCRPVGEPMVITKAERNVVRELGGKPAYEQLRLIYDRLPNRDKELFQRGVHLGRVINEYQDRFNYGDFLVRNVTGIDEDDGSLLIGDFVRVGQTVQFHVRDATTASDDLRQQLQQKVDQKPEAALLFTCNGRGMRLFDEPHHDARLVGRQGNTVIPTAGFFCQGEIGPVGGLNFLHGFSASVAFFHA